MNNKLPTAKRAQILEMALSEQNGLRQNRLFFSLGG